MKLYQNQSINESIGLLNNISTNSHFDIDIRLRELKLEFDQDIFIHFKHLCEVTANRSISEGARGMAMFFSKKTTVTLTLALEPSNSKLFIIFSYFTFVGCCCCIVVLRPRYTSKVMSGRSVNLTTLFLGRLRPPKRLTSTSCTYIRQ